jgi:hypothetical protein
MHSVEPILVYDGSARRANAGGNCMLRAKPTSCYPCAKTAAVERPSDLLSLFQALRRFLGFLSVFASHAL